MNNSASYGSWAAVLGSFRGSEVPRDTSDVGIRVFRGRSLNELPAKLKPGAMQTAADRAHRNGEEAGDFIVVAVLDLAENQNRSMFRAKSVEGRSEFRHALLAQQARVRTFHVLVP